MCQSCIEIDKRIERYREALRSITDQAEIERLNRLITELYRDRVWSHRNPDE
jgi:predicted  nucleic acid-binding Zn-ribbon protein